MDTSNTNRPLRWYYFLLYWQFPISIILSLIVLFFLCIGGFDTYNAIYGNLLFAFFDIIIFLLHIVTWIGLLTRKKYGYMAIQSCYIIDICISALLCCIIMDITLVPARIAQIIMDVLSIIYFKKRKYLFGSEIDLNPITERPVDPNRLYTVNIYDPKNGYTAKDYPISKLPKNYKKYLHEDTLHAYMDYKTSPPSLCLVSKRTWKQIQNSHSVRTHE